MYNLTKSSLHIKQLTTDAIIFNARDVWSIDAFLFIWDSFQMTI